MKLNELRCLVTGAASGLGRAIALGLCREGARVAALDLNEAGLGQLEEEARGLPGQLLPLRADVTREEEVVAAVKRASEAFEFLNGLVNNAGIYRDGVLVKVDRNGRVLKMPRAQWQVVIDTDLTGPYLLAREVAAQMIEKKVQPGIIINVSSISRAGVSGQTNYSAAKAGVVADARVWAEELAPYGIRAAAIAPGFFQTPILDAMKQETLDQWLSRIPLKRLGNPDEIFAAVRFIVECEYFNGSCLELDGGLRA
ncbi:SDR family oxidoreductase [Corallococcus exercitus]|uniref:SDR family oxidoreductase n=1 Tax=Corallococcus exercitus TaxID=2316736 RepID=A0A3A8HKG6_9BACT|nr:SDR family oxidoreductase [Corallococcus exercitus]NOK38480.1 SDR family oxidoreductase [Corallococcus exercitus]RKG71008.1 SDR family oxidoreductase [Corallococcus exercitus]